MEEVQGVSNNTHPVSLLSMEKEEWNSSAEQNLQSDITEAASEQSSTVALTTTATQMIYGDDEDFNNDFEIKLGLLRVPGLQNFENKEISIELQAEDLLDEILEILPIEIGDANSTFSKDNFNISYGSFTDGSWQLNGAVSWDTIVSQTTSKSFVVMPTMKGAAELFTKKFKDEERRLLQQRGILDYTGPTKVQVIIKEVPVPEQGGLSKVDADILKAKFDLTVQQIKLLEMQSIKLRQIVARKLPSRDAPQDGKAKLSKGKDTRVRMVVKGGLSKVDADILIAERDMLVQQIKLFEMESVKLRQEVARKLPDRDLPKRRARMLVKGSKLNN